MLKIISLLYNQFYYIVYREETWSYFGLILSPTNRQCKKTILQDGVTLNLRGFFIGKTGRSDQIYTEEFKGIAVKLYKDNVTVTTRDLSNS